jgi:hypothetical protein
MIDTNRKSVRERIQASPMIDSNRKSIREPVKASPTANASKPLQRSIQTKIRSANAYSITSDRIKPYICPQTRLKLIKANS